MSTNSPLRASPEKLNEQIGQFAGDSFTQEFAHSVPLIFMILNDTRQIVYANKTVFDLLGLKDTACVYGQRPGELFNCVNAKLGPDGCGTSPYCENCGAFQAIMDARSGSASVKECRLNVEGTLAEDFRISTNPVERDGERFIIITLEDIQHEKRRQVLEQTFFHDILNTAGGLSGLTEVLDFIEEETERKNILNMIQISSRRLIDEIHSGRALSQAENGSLELVLLEQDMDELARKTLQFYQNHPVCERRQLEMAEDSKPVILETDPAILQRVISNLIKNALEASNDGNTVTVGVRNEDHAAVLWVRNETVMPKTVKDQIFQRSFSTKGKGRGVGTYSIKLFTEKYLGGTVRFESAEGTGTIFKISFPL